MAKETTDLAAIETKCIAKLPELRAYSRSVFEGLRTSVESAIACGAILNEIKGMLPHGRFEPFIKQYLVADQMRTYRNWMKAATNWTEISNRKLVSYLSNDVTVMQLVNYDKLTPENALKSLGATPPSEKAKKQESKPSAPPDNGSPGPVAVSKDIEEDDPTAEECMESAASDIEKFCRYILKEWKDKMPHDPWLDHKGLSDSAGQAIKSALATMRLAKCKDLCPKCDWNEKCKTCLGTGRIPKCELNQLG